MLKDKSVIYTRYADDMCFSSNTNNLEGINFEVEKIVAEKGFRINQRKTRFMGEHTPKVITDLNITTKLKIQSDFKRKLRQEIYFCKKYGVNDHLDKSSCGRKVNFDGYLYGKAYYIKMVEPEIGENFLKELDEIFSDKYLCYWDLMKAVYPIKAGYSVSNK